MKTKWLHKTVRRRGIRSKTTSDAAKAVQSLTLHFWEFPGSAGALEGKTITITGPDGKKDQQKIPKDGTIDLKKTKPGRHKVEAGKEILLKSIPKPDPAPSFVLQSGSAGSTSAEDLSTTWKGKKEKTYAHQNDFNEDIATAARKYGFEPRLLKALIAQESGFDQLANNSAGFAGLTQIGGAAIKEAGLNKGKTEKANGEYKYDFSGDERFNATKSIYAGAFILSIKRKRIDKFIFSKFKTELSSDEKMKFYLGAYNAGEGLVRKAWVINGQVDCVWDELTKGKKSSAIWASIPKAWGSTEQKFNEIRNYPNDIIQRKNS